MSVPALAAIAAAKAAGTPRSFAEVTYFPIHAYGWRDATDHLRWVRYRLEPVEAVAGRPAASTTAATGSSTSWPTGWRPALSATTSASPWRGPPTTRTTRCRSGAAPASSAPAILTVTEEAPDPEADGGLVVFDPTRVVDGIELSDDPILRYRPSAYSVSIKRRST